MLKWTVEEKEVLRAGVAKHGTGKWKTIQRDPEFNHFLYARSTVELKDKWRNICHDEGVNCCPGDDVKVPKRKRPDETFVVPQPSCSSTAHSSTGPSTHAKTKDSPTRLSAQVTLPSTDTETNDSPSFLSAEVNVPSTDAEIIDTATSFWAGDSLSSTDAMVIGSPPRWWKYLPDEVTSDAAN